MRIIHAAALAGGLAMGAGFVPSTAAAQDWQNTLRDGADRLLGNQGNGERNRERDAYERGRRDAERSYGDQDRYRDGGRYGDRSRNPDAYQYGRNQDRGWDDGRGSYGDQRDRR